MSYHSEGSTTSSYESGSDTDSSEAYSQITVDMDCFDPDYVGVIQMEFTLQQPVTEHEVYNFLREIKRQQQRFTPTPLATVTYEALRYLERRPAALPVMTMEKMRSAKRRLERHPSELNKYHILQFLNDPPQNILDVQVMLGDHIHRVTEEEVEDLVKVSLEEFGRISHIREIPEAQCQLKALEEAQNKDVK